MGDRNYTPLVREALAYWNENGPQYGDYDVEYRLRPNASNPDILVRFVGEINDCGPDDENVTLGCASVLNKRMVAEDPEVVRVISGLSNESTVETLEHEIGHTRGLRHGESPMPLMSAIDNDTTREPTPNVSERTDPWGDRETLRVAIVGSQATRTATRNAKHALDYYEAGADGWVPEDERYDFEVVENASRADITIRLGPEHMTYTFRGEERVLEGGSVQSYYGLDVDGDGAFEQYTNMTIYVSDINGHRVAWHVGAQIASAYGGTSTQVPEPFREGKPRDAVFWD